MSRKKNDRGQENTCDEHVIDDPIVHFGLSSESVLEHDVTSQKHLTEDYSVHSSLSGECVIEQATTSDEHVTHDDSVQFTYFSPLNEHVHDASGSDIPIHASRPIQKDVNSGRRAKKKKKRSNRRRILIYESSCDEESVITPNCSNKVVYNESDSSLEINTDSEHHTTGMGICSNNVPNDLINSDDEKVKCHTLDENENQPIPHKLYVKISHPYIMSICSCGENDRKCDEKKSKTGLEKDSEENNMKSQFCTVYQKKLNFAEIK